MLQVLSVQFVSFTGGVVFDVPVDATSKRWTFSARVTMDPTRNRFGPLCVLRWYARAALIDVMYDTPFDESDPLVGQFTVAVDEDFLTTKYGWAVPTGGQASPPTNTLQAVLTKNEELKRESGSCPMLSQTHQRSRDLAPEALGPDVLAPTLKRMEWMDSYVASEAVNGSFGSIDLTQQDYTQPLLWYHLQEKEDEVALGRNAWHAMGEFDPILRKYQLHCLAPAFNYYLGFIGMQGYSHWKYEEALAHSRDSTRVRKKPPIARFVAPITKHLFEYTGSDESRLASRALLYDMLPPRTGYAMPPLSTKFAPKPDGRAASAVNLTYVPEMVYALTLGWVAGEHLPDDLALELAAYWRACTSLRTFESMSSFSNFFHAPGSNPCNAAIGPRVLARFGAFLGGSPVWEIARARDLAHGFKYSDLWSNPVIFAQALVQEMQGLVNMNVYLTEFLLQNEEAQQSFRDDPDKAILELLRLGVGSAQLTEPVAQRTGNRSCPVRNSEGGFIGLNVPDSLDEVFSFGVANRDPARFARPNTFDPQRPDWMHNIVFAAPLEVFYNVSSEGSSAPSPGGELPAFDDAKPLTNASQYFCLGAYLVIEVSKFVMSTVLDAQADVYREHVSACTDNELEAERVFGPAMYPEMGSVCEHAVGRVDANESWVAAAHSWALPTAHCFSTSLLSICAR